MKLCNMSSLYNLITPEPPPPPSDDGGSCFHGSSRVLLDDGKTRKMSDLQVGESVLAVDEKGELLFSPVILHLHTSPEDSATFLRINTHSGHSLSVTPNHLIYMLSKNDAYREKVKSSNNQQNEREQGKTLEANTKMYQSLFKPEFASKIKECDFVLVHDNIRGLMVTKVKNVKKLNLTGVYSPLTSEGNIIVDSVLASCYSDFDSHTLQHMAWAPFRWLNKALTLTAPVKQRHDENANAYHQDVGVHWHGQALHQLAKIILPWKLDDE